jgi:pyruvate kinase
MAWGVHAVQVDVTGADTDVTQVLNEASRIAVEQRFAKCGDNIAIAAGLPFGQSGSTNLLHINRIGD